MKFDPKNDYDDDDDDDDGENNKRHVKSLPPPKMDPTASITSKLKQKLIEKKLIPVNDEDDESDRILYPGLPYMLEKKYFIDSFILHEESDATEELNKMLQKLSEEVSDSSEHNELKKYIEENKDDEEDIVLDARTKLTLSWGSMRNSFRFQVKFFLYFS